VSLTATLTALDCTASPAAVDLARIIDPAAFAVVEHPEHDQHLSPVSAPYADRIKAACQRATEAVADGWNQGTPHGR
jgi:hypothetical protein